MIFSQVEDSTEQPSAAQPQRRDFLRTCITAVAGITIIGVVSPLLSSCADAITGPGGGIPSSGTDGNGGTLFDVSSLTADGQGVFTQMFGTDGYQMLIVRRSATVYQTLSCHCTHEACAVSAPSGGSITCDCHGSKFDLTGAVLQGPAKQALKTYSTTFDASTKIVTVKVA